MAEYCNNVKLRVCTFNLYNGNLFGENKSFYLLKLGVGGRLASRSCDKRGLKISNLEKRNQAFFDKWLGEFLWKKLFNMAFIVKVGILRWWLADPFEALENLSPKAILNFFLIWSWKQGWWDHCIFGKTLRYHMSFIRHVCSFFSGRLLRLHCLHQTCVISLYGFPLSTRVGMTLFQENEGDRDPWPLYLFSYDGSCVY